YGPGRPYLNFGFRTILVEDGLDTLLLAPFDQAAVLGQVDRDPLARDDVGVTPYPRIADEHEALVAVVVLGALRRPHPAVAGDDPDIARGHHPLDAVRLGVRVDLHPVGVLDGVVLLGHHAALEHRQPFLLHALEAVGVHGHRTVLARRGGRRGRIRGLGLGGALLKGARFGGCDRAPRSPRDGARTYSGSHSLLWGGAAAPPPKVAVTRPRTIAISCEGTASSPVPLTTPPER